MRPDRSGTKATFREEPSPELNGGQATGDVTVQVLQNARSTEPETERRIEAGFPPGSRNEDAEILQDQCSTNLPSLEGLNEFELERFRFAALKVSAGDIEKLRKAIELAKKDWRDLLMALGFASDPTSHKRRAPNSKNIQ
jgi:hypothetical protein